MYIEGGGEQRFLLPLLDEWERRLVRDIKPGDVIDLANKLYPTASAATKNRQVITPVLSIIRFNAERGRCAPILIPRFEVKKIVRRKTATWEWVQKLAEKSKPKVTALVLFLASTGARIGDAMALDLSDVDFDAGTALLRDTKNGEDRIVQLLPVVREAIRFIPRAPKDTRAFPFFDRSDAARQIATACRKAGIDYIPTHGIGRRLFATTLNRKGVDAKTAAKLGGWKSVRMFIDIYAQADDTPGIVEDAIGTELSQAVKLRSAKL
jgi:integrase